MTVEIGILIAVIGCFVGLAGWLKGRDQKIGSDGEWRGSVNTKLDAIHNDISGIGAEVKCIKETLAEHGERITAAEQSAKQAHKRIDELAKGGGRGGD